MGTKKTQIAEREPLVNPSASRIGVEYESRYLVTIDSASRQTSVQQLTLLEHQISPLVFIDAHVVLSFVSPYFM